MKKNEMLIDNLKILDNETLEEQKIRKIVLMIDNLHSKILDYDKETQEKIIDYAFRVFENEDFFDFVSYEFEGEELEKIISKYFKNQGVKK